MRTYVINALIWFSDSLKAFLPSAGTVMKIKRGIAHVVLWSGLAGLASALFHDNTLSVASFGLALLCSALYLSWTERCDCDVPDCEECADQAERS
jgi:hypothetical protein